MSVELIYRTPYNHFDNKFHKSFPEVDTVLEWFQNLWRFHDEDPHQFYENASDYIGIRIYGFWGPFRIYDEEFDISSNPSPPNDFSSLKEYLNNGYCNVIDMGENENFIQVLTDDDELELAYYIFDSSYLKEDPTSIDYLLKQDYSLPLSFSTDSDGSVIDGKYRTIETNKGKKGKVYFLRSNTSGGDNLSSAENSVVIYNGIRLPELYDFVLDDHDDDLEILRLFAQGSLEQTINKIVRFKKHWVLIYREFYEKFSYDDFNEMTPKEGSSYVMQLVDNAEEKIIERHFKEFKPSSKSKYQVSDHFLQFSLNTDSWGTIPLMGTSPADLYDHFIIFDDLWASKNEILAKSLINFFKGWKVLK